MPDPIITEVMRAQRAREALIASSTSMNLPASVGSKASATDWAAA
jgi:hypothetical protein